MSRSSKLIVRGSIALAIGALLACETIAGINDYVIGECKGGGSCGADAAEVPDTFVPEEAAVQPPDDSGVACPGKPMPPAIRVGNQGNTFCIDTTEVTNAQYQTFLDAKVDPKSQPPKCAWNTSFETATIDGGANLPVANVDWCDALAYCTWAGKYLCGSATGGKKQGPVTLEGTSDFTTHQWMIACSAGGRLRYPYGAQPKPSSCNTAEYDAGKTLPVATINTCVGGYIGLHDLVGNVWEWYDGPCRADAGLEPVGPDAGDGGPHADDCWIKGGAFTSRGAEFDCRFDGQGVRRDLKNDSVGFRCCSD